MHPEQNKKSLAYKVGQACGLLITGCIAAVVLALALKLIMFIFAL